MSLMDDDRPKKPALHDIGGDLSLLSTDELGHRIDLLKQEIDRIEAERAAKLASRSAADRLFR